MSNELPKITELKAGIDLTMDIILRHITGTFKPTAEDWHDMIYGRPMTPEERAEIASRPQYGKPAFPGGDDE